VDYNWGESTDEFSNNNTATIRHILMNFLNTGVLVRQMISFPFFDSEKLPTGLA
jgi:hypothetical protein